MELVDASSHAIELRLGRDEVGLLVGSLGFLYSQLPDRDFETILGSPKVVATALRDELGKNYRRMRSLDPSATEIGSPPDFDLMSEWLAEVLAQRVSLRELYHRLWPMKEWYLFHGATFDMPAESLDDPAGAFSYVWSRLSIALGGGGDTKQFRRALSKALPVVRSALPQ